MKINRVTREAFVWALVFLSLQTLQGFLLKNALAKQERVAAHRLALTMGGVLNKAHRSKDDLLLSQAMAALDQAPGVIHPHIAALDEKSKTSGNSVWFPLRDGAEKWGTLVFSLSTNLNHQLVRRQWFLGTLSMALAWGFLFLYLQGIEKRAAGYRLHITELEGLLKAEKQRSTLSEDRERTRALEDSARFEKALWRVEEPLIVLDSHQRVSGISHLARARLGIRQEESVLGKSWLEIPVLSSSGTSLERSLANSGQAISCPVKDKGCTLIYETDANGLAGTWISISVE
jgi:hypothetical protein